MKTKIATDIRQSRELLKLGLDPKTADMHYWTAWAGFAKEKRDTPIVGLPPKDAIETYWIPAWSLSALLELMPKSLKVDMLPSYSLTMDWYDGFSYVRSEHPLEPQGICDADSFIDNAYKMVVWLIEQGHIKTKKRNE